LKPNQGMVAQFVFHNFKLRRRAAAAGHFAMQTFFGSVKKPAFAKATARQAPAFSSASNTNILCLCEKM
jgi:hypothetical protein